MAGLTVLAVSAVMAVSIMTATPLNSTPLFRDPESEQSDTILHLSCCPLVSHCNDTIFRFLTADFGPPPPHPKKFTNSILCGTSRGSGVRKRVVSKRVVSADVPPERKPEQGYVRQNRPFGNRPFISQ